MNKKKETNITDDDLEYATKHVETICLNSKYVGVSQDLFDKLFKNKLWRRLDYIKLVTSTI